MSLTENLTFAAELHQMLRYGENPHQNAGFYTNGNPPKGTIAAATKVQGKELSYNNIVDADAALECAKQFTQPACVIVKHANPCGVAVQDDLIMAYRKAYETDPTSAFGGIIAFNDIVSEELADNIIKNQFAEVVIAPDFTRAAVLAFNSKRNLRVLSYGFEQDTRPAYEFKEVGGGILVQERDTDNVSLDTIECVTNVEPTLPQIRDLLFAWKVAMYVKSNAIVYAKDTRTIGVGAGQMSRVVSAKIAGWKATDAGLTVPGSVMASDAFFPFRDGIDTAAANGIAAVIQPGGSQRDQEVIDAANEANIAMVFTKTRHFRH